MLFLDEVQRSQQHCGESLKPQNYTIDVQSVTFFKGL